MFSLPIVSGESLPPSIQEIYKLLANNPVRNQMIVTDVLTAIASGRSPVLLTERREHLDYFTKAFSGKVKNLLVLFGGMSRKQQTSIMEQLKNIPREEERLIIATGRYLGEGFDDARLDIHYSLLCLLLGVERLLNMPVVFTAVMKTRTK
jgi:superfamily II DNA or RNA helicase